MPTARNTRFLAVWWLGALLVGPWLNPYTAGPAPNTWPWLVSMLCGALLWLFRRHLTARLVIDGWLAVAMLSSVIALLQYFGQSPFFSPWISQAQAGEAFANLRQRNQFATLTSIGLVALLALVARRSEAPARVPAWAYLAVVLLAIGNAASNSRTGLLQWILIALLAGGWAAPGQRRSLLFALQALLAYAVTVLTLPWLLEWATGVRSGGLFGRLAEVPGCQSRKILWSNVLHLIAEKPWLGWGWGELDYAHFITLYPGAPGERFCEILDNAHNLPLHLAVELGVPVALAACAGALWLVWRAQPWHETDPLRQAAWGVLAVIGLHSLLEYPLWYGPFQIAVALCLGLLWTAHGATAASPSNPQRKFQSKRPFKHYLQASTAIISIAVLIAAAVSYSRVSQIYLPPAERSAAYRHDTLNKIKDSWLFRNPARFAELTMTPLTPENAAALNEMAKALLHYSPEPRVIEKVIESAVMLGRDDEALQYLARYRAAFPLEHARWAEGNARMPGRPG